MESEEWRVVRRTAALPSGSFRGKQTTIKKDEPRMDANSSALNDEFCKRLTGRSGTATYSSTLNSVTRPPLKRTRKRPSAPPGLRLNSYT